MTENEKKYLEKPGAQIIDLTKISPDELSKSDKEFLNFIEADGGIVTEICHF